MREESITIKITIETTTITNIIILIITNSSIKIIIIMAVKTKKNNRITSIKVITLIMMSTQSIMKETVGKITMLTEINKTDRTSKRLFL